MLDLPLPSWLEVWFAVFPNAKSLIAQALAAVIVLGSYFGAQYVRRWRPRRRRAMAAAEGEPLRGC